ncbi:MAG TPA: D-Ala-D-Ala carboxypeptidase family metallohydrolase [Gemmatimonadaceae bacterium]|nr:D-Ala-D-Ala carboxypeptidase family metallohydrolase [Gemmatimonadaceae bacterium]
MRAFAGVAVAVAMALALGAPAAMAGGGGGGGGGSASPAPVLTGNLFDLLDSLAGLSHKLRARFVSADKRELAGPALTRLFGDSAAVRPGAYAVQDSTVGQRFTFFTLLPFSVKQKGRIGSYRVGNWPYERRPARNELYSNPAGFIQVTTQNEDTYVSEHFRLRDFLTHDQENVWPKYLVLDERLVDKLELIIDDLNAHGVRVAHLTIMSGFRTPEYNREGVGEGGRARDSRHQFGDAADIFVDNDGSGRMSDLNHDHKVDWRDAKVIRDAIDRVEAAHPELVGGAGIYKGNRRHGPFVHVDARGTRARWGKAVG